MVVKPLQTLKTPEICEAIKQGFIRYFDPPTHIMCDQDPAFMSGLAHYFFKQFGIRIITVSTTNHQFLLNKHGIKSLANILKKHLGEYGTKWTDYLDFAMLVYNSYCSASLAGLSHIRCVLGRGANFIPLQELKLDCPVTGTHKQYFNNLCTKLSYLQKHLQKFQDQ